MALDKDYAERLANWRHRKAANQANAHSAATVLCPKHEMTLSGTELIAFVCRRCGRLEMMERSRVPQPGDKELDGDYP